MSAGSPYVNAGSKAGYKGYNYQNKRWVTQDRPSKGSDWEILGSCQWQEQGERAQSSLGASAGDIPSWSFPVARARHPQA